MNDDELRSVLVALFLAIASLVFGIFLGFNWAARVERAAAIQAGVARWAVDPETGETRFEYLSPGAKP